MKRRKIGILKWLKTRLCTGWVILAMVLPVMSGCATDGRVESKAVAERPTFSQEPKAAQLADGRKGFIITEVPRLDDAARRDFQQAVAMVDAGVYDVVLALGVEKLYHADKKVSFADIGLAVDGFKGLPYEETGPCDGGTDNCGNACSTAP